MPVHYFQSTMLVNPIYSEYLQTGTLASSEYPNSISSVFALFVKENQQSPGTNIHKFKDICGYFQCAPFPRLQTGKVVWVLSFDP